MTAAVLRIVLVEPREAGNIGAAARAMKNFGFSEMALVGALPPLQPVAEWWASGAEDVVHGALRFESLSEALADCHAAIATTSSRGRTLEEVLRPPQVAQMRSELAPSQRLALVFGREDRGLTTAEADLCGRIAVIPTNGEFGTMNLAQAVSIFCYEMRREERAVAEVKELAPQALVERLHQQALTLLLECGFLHEKNPERLYAEFRALAARAELTPREAELLLAAVKQVQWKRG
jgi:tRNA/rRNA methyltransferase